LRIGIKRKRSVVGLTAHIAYRKHEVSGDPAFDRQAPLLARGCEQFRIDTAGAVKPAGWLWKRPWEATSNRKLVVLPERNEGESRTHNLLARVERWIGIGPVREIILKIVVDSKAGPNRPGSRAGGIPGQTDARLQQQFGMIHRQAGFGHA